MALSTKDHDNFFHGSFATALEHGERQAGRTCESRYHNECVDHPRDLRRGRISATSYFTTNYSLHRVKSQIPYGPMNSVIRLLVAAILLNCLIIPASAVSIPYQDCLPDNYRSSGSLQFKPLRVNAVFNSTDPSHNLNVTVWGNVTGSLPLQADPLPLGSNTSYWDNPNNTIGKIVDVPEPTGPNVKTSFFRKVNVLTYQPYLADVVDFCDTVVNGTCPLGPVFAAGNS